MDKKINLLLKIALIFVILSLFFNIYNEIITFIKLLFKIVLPFLVGFTIAFLLNPIVDKLERKKCNRKVVSTVLVVSLILIFVVMIFNLGPIVVKEGKELLNNLPEYILNIKNFIEKIKIKIFKNNIIEIDIETELKEKILPYLFTYFTSFLQTTFSYIISITVGVVLSLYFLIDYHKIIRKIKVFFVNKGKNNIIQFLKKLEQTMYAYFKGIIFVMILLSAISTICFLLIGIELSFIWGLIIGVTNVIPYIGPYIGGIIVGVFTLGSAPSKIPYVILVIVILQIVESNFITPKVESKTVHTHPVLVILFMTIFSEILGIIGLLLAVPVLSSLQLALKWQKSN